MNPLDKITGTLVTGLVLAILLVVVLGSEQAFNFDVVLRWVHIAAGIAWIGLLYYFNFVQVPGLAEAAPWTPRSAPPFAAIRTSGS